MCITLYKMDASPPARAVVMVIELLQIPDVQYTNIDIFAKQHLTEEFLKINPQHTLPTLKHGDFIIWDSHAICSYLVSTYGKDDSLYPKDPKKRAVVDQRLHFDGAILFTALHGALFPVLFLNESKFRPEVLTNIVTAYEFCEKFLDSKPWIAGDQMTIADICCVATISALNWIVPVDKEKYPNFHFWFEKCCGLEVCVKVNAPGNQITGDIIKKEWF